VTASLASCNGKIEMYIIIIESIISWQQSAMEVVLALALGYSKLATKNIRRQQYTGGTCKIVRKLTVEAASTFHHSE